jgi:hypothetical protein
VKLDYMLKGSNQLSYDENCSLFGFVQQFVLDTCRFCYPLLCHYMYIMSYVCFLLLSLLVLCVIFPNLCSFFFLSLF